MIQVVPGPELKFAARAVYTLNHKVIFPVPSPSILHRGTNKAQQREVAWSKLLFIANKYGNQRTRPDLCCELWRWGSFCDTRRQVSIGGASPGEESHPPNPCLPLAPSSRCIC